MNGDMAGQGVVLQFFHHFPSVLHGQLNIQQDACGFVGLCHTDGRVPADRHDALVSFFAAEVQQGFGEYGIVSTIRRTLSVVFSLFRSSGISAGISMRVRREAFLLCPVVISLPLPPRVGFSSTSSSRRVHFKQRDGDGEFGASSGVLVRSISQPSSLESSRLIDSPRTGASVFAPGGAVRPAGRLSEDELMFVFGDADAGVRTEKSIKFFWVGEGATRRVMEPFGVNLKALDRRFLRICSSRILSVSNWAGVFSSRIKFHLQVLCLLPGAGRASSCRQ